MPTPNPRISVVVTPERHELLRRLASLQQSSMAQIINETMEMVYPVLERVCVVLEAANKAQETRKDGLRQIVSKAELELLPHLYDAVSQFDLFMCDLEANTGASASPAASDAIRKVMEGPAPGGGDTRSGALPAGVDPRICNTGVRLSGKGKKTPSPAVRKGGSKK